MSNETFTLPSGATVTLRDPKSIRQKDRKKLYEVSNDQTGLLQSISMTEGVIAMIVESWTLSNFSLPNFDISVLGELDIPDYDALSEKASEYVPVLFPQTSKVKGTTPDDASPFVSSSDSVTP